MTAAKRREWICGPPRAPTSMHCSGSAPSFSTRIGGRSMSGLDRAAPRLGRRYLAPGGASRSGNPRLPRRGGEGIVGPVSGRKQRVWGQEAGPWGKAVKTLLQKIESPRAAGAKLARTIDWSGLVKGRTNVLCLERSQFIKDIEELRRLTEISFVFLNAVRLKRRLEVWVPEE